MWSKEIPKVLIIRKKRWKKSQSQDDVIGRASFTLSRFTNRGNHNSGFKQSLEVGKENKNELSVM